MPTASLASSCPGLDEAQGAEESMEMVLGTLKAWKFRHQSDLTGTVGFL